MDATELLPLGGLLYMPAETQETEVDAETQETDTDTGETNLARLWFKRHAWFNTPPYETPSTSHSSSEVQDARIGSLKCKLPTLAFPDKEKVKRFTKALDDALKDDTLKAGSISPGITDDKKIEAIFKKLFSPECEEKDGFMLIEWRRITNEVDSNRLTLHALMNAVAAVTKRMFEKDITVRTEPMNLYQDETTNQKPKLGKKEYNISQERVDMIVTDETGRGQNRTKDTVKESVLYLIEGKNPNVIEAIAKMFKKGKVIELDLYSNTTNQRKILNKIIYCMLFWDIPRLVVTSFTTTFILELHHTDKGCFVSYSPRLDANEKTTLFRAIFGLTLVALKIVDYEEFPAVAAFAAYKKQRAKEKADARLTHSSIRGSGAGAGSGSRSSKKGVSGTGWKNPTKKMNGKNTSDVSKQKSTSKSGTKRPLDISSVDAMASDRTVSNGSSMMPEPTSPSECDKAVLNPKDRDGLVIRLEDSKEFTLGTGLHQIEFVREARAPFPGLPTTDRVPCLTLHEEISWGSAGTVYYSELQAPWDAKASNFIVKVLDAKLRSHREYRNAFKELHKEYETYYLFGQLKHDNKFSDIIERTTPTCYGLYRARRKRRDVFALVIEYAGEVTLDPWKDWELSEKKATLTSMISLHSLGLLHGDTAERNTAIKRDDGGQVETVKVFDFDNTCWHECRGIVQCEELEVVWDDLFPDDDAPFDRWDFEEKTVHLYGLPSCNLKLRYGKLPEMDDEAIVQRLKELSELYDEEHDYAM